MTRRFAMNVSENSLVVLLGCAWKQKSVTPLLTTLEIRTEAAGGVLILLLFFGLMAGGTNVTVLSPPTVLECEPEFCPNFIGYRFNSIINNIFIFILLNLYRFSNI